MSEATIKIIIPHELSDVVNKDDIAVLEHGIVHTSTLDHAYLYNKIVYVPQEIAMFHVLRTIFDEKGIKPGDKVAYVTYKYQGRSVFDFFKIVD